MGFRLVPKSTTLNDLERRNGPYFALFHELSKPAFQHITSSARIDVIDQKSASMNTQSGKVCVRNKMQGFQRYLLLICRLSFALPLLSLF